jgi:hypothetical protein
MLMCTNQQDCSRGRTPRQWRLSAGQRKKIEMIVEIMMIIPMFQYTNKSTNNNNYDKNNNKNNHHNNNSNNKNDYKSTYLWYIKKRCQGKSDF